MAGRLLMILRSGELDTYLRAFARVYYWIGNMMPVSTNALWGRRDDNWKTKLSFIQKCFLGEDAGQEKYSWQFKWREWIGHQWLNRGKDFRNFVEENYLQDAVKAVDCLRIKDLWEGNEQGCLAKFFSIEEMKKWLITNTKFIIQRSYRICYGFSGDFHDGGEAGERLQMIFSAVFGENIDLEPF